MNFDVDLFGFNEWFIKEFKLSPEVQIDDFNPSIQVEWSFYMEMRTWGVKSIGAYPTKVSFNDPMVVTFYDQDDEHHEFEVKEDQLNKLISEFEIDSNDCRRSNDQMDNMFCVTNVEINFDDKSIEIEF